MNQTTLFRRDHNDNLLIWTIEAFPQDALLVIEFGREDGDKQTKEVNVEINQSGRGFFDQCELELNARVEKKKQQGYIGFRPVKGGVPSNALGLPKPMLAKKYSHALLGKDKIYVQPKYDGNRCLINISEVGVVGYSRNGKVLKGLRHIFDEYNKFSGVFDWTLDGELYCHGESLQTIVSWIKREQPESAKIKYMLYDVIQNKSYDERYKAIKQISDGLENTVLSETTKHISLDVDQVAQQMVTHRERGYEGSILRINDRGYEIGKRSSSLLKVKHFLDDEFLVKDVELTKDGQGILVLQAKNGRAFRCNPPGDFDARYYTALHKSEFIGKKVTVEYANLTKDGIPFHPIAKRYYTTA